MAADAELATRLHQQGAAGLGEVYRAYADRLHGYAITLTHDRDMAADAVHDTFLVALDRIGQLRDLDKLRPWLFAIARNECLRRLRDRNRLASASDSQEVLDAMGDEPDLTADISREEASTLVHSALTGLSPADRDVLTLAIGADLDAAALGAVLGVDSKGVHARLSRAREALGASVTALVLARTKGRDCSGLATILQEHRGFDPLLRKRISRHVKQCDSCDRRGRAAALACAPALAAPVVAVSAPAGLADSLLGPDGSAWDTEQVAAAGHRAAPFGPDGFPTPLPVPPDPHPAAMIGPPPSPPPASRRHGGRRRKLMVGAAGIGMLTLALFAWTTVTDQEPPTTTAATTGPSPSPQAISSTPTPVPSSPVAAPEPGNAQKEDGSKEADTAEGNASDSTPDTTGKGGQPDDPVPVAAAPPPPSVAAEEAPGAAPLKDGSKGSGNGKEAPPPDGSQKGNDGSRPRPTPTPSPTSTTGPTPTPTPRPSAPRIAGLAVTDVDRAPDGSFTRCDAFTMVVSATLSGQVTSATAGYGSGSFPLTASGAQWQGTATLPPGEYTVTVTVKGPGGITQQNSTPLLHICPG